VTATEHEPEAPTHPQQAAGESILDRLREKRRQEAGRSTIDLPISGWGGDVIARYRLLDPLVEGRDIAERVRAQYREDQAAQEFYALIDTLIAACDGLYARDTDGEVKPLSLNGGGPATYTVELAAALGVEEAATARDVVIGLFKGNKVAARAHALRLQMWMADPEGTLRLGEL
jgi:hypothetical protein